MKKRAQLTILPIVTPASSAIVNWKTYKNEKLGFQLQFPPSWFVNDDYPRIYLAAQKLAPENLKGLTHVPGSFEVLIDEDDSGKHITEFKEYTQKGIVIKNFNGEASYRIEKINFSGKELYAKIQFREANMASVGG